jgi:hypothetical protein
VEGAAELRTWSNGDRLADRGLTRLRELREALHVLVLSQLGPLDDSHAGDGGIRRALDLVGLRWSQAVSRSRLNLGDGPGPLLVDVGTQPGEVIEDRSTWRCRRRRLL